MKRAFTLLPLLLLLPADLTAQGTGRPAPWYLTVPDAGAVLTDLGVLRLEGSLVVRFLSAGGPSASERARTLQVEMLEGAAFWQNLLGSLPAGGVIMARSDLWTAIRPDLWYGFPAAVVRDGGPEVFALIAQGDSTRFGDHGGELAKIVPIAWQGRLSGYGMGDRPGAERYARAWRWVVVAESLTEGMRIGAQSWWQRRIVGAAAAWLLLDAPRGSEIAPGEAAVLDVWSWFLQGYYAPLAVGLAEGGRTPADRDPRILLEMDARLLRFAREIALLGAPAFERIRAAWPIEGAFETVEEALDALFAELPGLLPWRERLLDPQGISWR